MSSQTTYAGKKSSAKTCRRRRTGGGFGVDVVGEEAQGEGEAGALVMVDARFRTQRATNAPRAAVRASARAWSVTMTAVSERAHRTSQHTHEHRRRMQRALVAYEVL